MRSRSRPGGASKTTRAGVAAGSSMATGPVGATGPSNSNVPSADRAWKTSFDTVRRTRSPGTLAAGSQTNVTRVLPFSPRDIPNHGRINRLVWGAGSAGTATFGAFAFAINALRSASSGDAVQ